VEPPVVINYKLIISCLILCLGCAAVPEIRLKPENLHYIVVNLVLDKVERLAEPGSKKFPPIKKEILSIGRFKLYTSFRLSLDRERQADEDLAEIQPRRSDTFNTNTKFRVDKDIIYIEFVLKW